MKASKKAETNEKRILSRSNTYIVAGDTGPSNLRCCPFELVSPPLVVHHQVVSERLRAQCLDSLTVQPKLLLLLPLHTAVSVMDPNDVKRWKEGTNQVSMLTTSGVRNYPIQHRSSVDKLRLKKVQSTHQVMLNGVLKGQTNAYVAQVSHDVPGLGFLTCVMVTYVSQTIKHACET